MSDLISDYRVVNYSPIEICGIPTGVTENHNESFYYWHKLGLRNSTLFHIDAHSDMNHQAPYENKPEDDYCRRLSISNFICAAVHYGIVSRVYWLQPQWEERTLQYMGGIHDSMEPLNTRVSNGKIFWESEEMRDFEKTIIEPRQVVVRGPLILDIDLDAFCQLIYDDSGLSYSDSLSHDKINESLDMLRTLKRPDMITITRSQGKDGMECFVPPESVDGIQRLMIDGLSEIYSGSV